jgi:TRAP transporter TAXI family solute receptor
VRNPIRHAGLWLSFAVAATTMCGAQAAKISMESTAATSVVGMVPQALAPKWAAAGVDVELALGQTLTKSLLKMGQGTLDSAVVPLPAYNLLVLGKGPYAQLDADKGKALADNVRSLFAFTASTFHPIVWADSGINTWADIKGKRVFIGPPAGAANAQIMGLIKAASGFEEGKDYTGIKAPWGVAADAFRDGQFDVYVGTYGVGGQALAELSLSRKIRILSMPNRNEPPAVLGLAVGTIPAGSYPGMVNTEPVIAWKTLMMMAVNKGVSDDTAYKLTKTYFDSIAALKTGNAGLSVLDPADAFDGLAAPLHPGALKYYKEVNRSVPATLAAR